MDSAHLNGDSTADFALAYFCREYRGPVINYLRSRGILESRVEDMAHDFLLHFMKADSVRRAHPNLGRFRSYLLASLKNFIASDVEFQTAKLRGGGAEHCSLEFAPEEELATNSSNAESLEHDRQWATNLMRISYERLEDFCAEDSRGVRLAVLKPFILPGASLPDLTAAAAELNLEEGHVRVLISRFRQRFRQFFREEVLNTVAGPEEVDDEIRHLLAALVQGGEFSAPDV